MFEKFLHRPALAIVISLLILFMGGLAINVLPISQFPSVAPPSVRVSVSYPGASEKILIDSSFGSIRDVVRAVSCGQALIGVVPVRNSSVGEVADTSAALGEHPEVAVLLRRKIPINLSLLAQDGVKPSDIRTVISKGQALLQCREWIRSNLPGAQLIEAGSTSEGM